ncbi:hypothetical protein CANCADRAFT_32332 [Tortispora caseinolytica NRRL Y-17796]|uniref:B box-type domain-containing protein n=1 Tax=Tortispora caseinolytica NRRL Y-17796 TaxID=767744 RepID=A0A1E4TB07_9ASCO|nr:hypothetical protein CANCADRAFT_32332 [Tortispora caseinolytica NRRL Y-17796]
MRRTLKDIISSEVKEDGDTRSDSASMMDVDLSADVDEGLCIDCGDQPGELICKTCDDTFCKVCFAYIHRTGKRKEHVVVELAVDSQSEEKTAADVTSAMQNEAEEQPAEEADGADENVNSTDIAESSSKSASEILERSKYIPLRLTADERKLLRLLEAALNVSEYTDKIDILAYTSKTKRIVQQLREMCSVLAGLVVASDIDLGQEIFQDKEFSDNAQWYQDIFEIGRRYKVMNPDKLRDTFGKLMYMIMDSRLPEVKMHMEFDLYKPMVTVYGFLEARDCVALLEDGLIISATAEINSANSRSQISSAIKRKEKAIELLASRYSTKKISKEQIRQCLYSIGDNHAYLRANQEPCEQMISYLTHYFSPDESSMKTSFLSAASEAIGLSSPDEDSLAIRYGRSGARLSHSHQKQYQYVLQSLSLWSMIMKDMFKLWMLADDDLLSNRTTYRLLNTGQGLNRVQACPNVSIAMQKIISAAQKRVGVWHGSSVVHLGDHAVPNSLFFLDKYLQVPRILNPLTIAIRVIDNELSKDPFVVDWATAQFGSIDRLKKIILGDFFRHGFDGSGADNFYDAGSCIDGRLTSAWNWANQVSKKDYYKMFLLTGFNGFNGSDGF